MANSRIYQVKAEVEIENGIQHGGQVQQSEVEAEVEEAAANSSYGVSFCPFAGGGGECSQAGSLATDGQGQGRAKLSLSKNTVLAGVFRVARSANQFVTGINIPRLPHDRGGAFKPTLQPVSAVNAGIDSRFPDARFRSVGVGHGGGGRRPQHRSGRQRRDGQRDLHWRPFGLGRFVPIGRVSGNEFGRAGSS